MNAHHLLVHLPLTGIIRVHVGFLTWVSQAPSGMAFKGMSLSWSFRCALAVLIMSCLVCGHSTPLGYRVGCIVQPRP